MKNRFNRLTSKEWLPFQKSWFRYETDEKLYADNLRFFCKAEPSEESAFYYGNLYSKFEALAADHTIKAVQSTTSAEQSLQFALIDLRYEINHIEDTETYFALRTKVIKLSEAILEQMIHRRFLCVLIPNIQKSDGTYFPFAWDIAIQLSSIFSLKDEKIACLPIDKKVSESIFQPNNDVFYCLYFRKDEHSNGLHKERKHNFFNHHPIVKGGPKFMGNIPAWFILKPTPRKKDEILHPAKYPEDLVTMFIKEFTEENANILDPMSGTGSTQVAALKSGRNAYGTELSGFFADIAVKRCQDIVQPSQVNLFDPPSLQVFKLINKDARLISEMDFPQIDYLITSPPYWDMLNMKGAENQAKRIEKGLQTNYSEDEDDLGNISDYESFMFDLTKVYFNAMNVMKSGSVITIIVKNIKKKGRNYPFAWDLADRLMTRLELLPEVFWCQDDINLAPYGYGNTFVSNTFHQYCLNFKKP